MTDPTDTRQRILDVAERLFADHGYAGTSLRGIITEARVNLAAVHYHFRSKEALLEAVLLRRLGPLNEERLALLDGIQSRPGSKSMRLEDVLFAFLAPPMRVFLGGNEGRIFGKLVGRLHSEPGGLFFEIAKRHFGPVSERFRAAILEAVPGVPKRELFWRMHFTIGVMAHTLSCWDHLEVMSNGVCKVSDANSAIPRMIDFIAAGFRAHPAGKKSRSRKNVHSEK